MKELNNNQLFAEAAKIDSPVIKELICRLMDAEHRAEINQIKLNHQIDLVSLLRESVDNMRQSVDIMENV